MYFVFLNLRFNRFIIMAYDRSKGTATWLNYISFLSHFPGAQGLHRAVWSEPVGGTGLA